MMNSVYVNKFVIGGQNKLNHCNISVYKNKTTDEISRNRYSFL